MRQSSIYIPTRTVRGILLFSVLTTLVLLGNSPAARAQANADHPVYLITSYRSVPILRVAFREYMGTTGVKRFEQWKREGVIADYKILFNSFVDEATWDMTIVLRFNKYEDSERWHEVTASLPGGLDSAGLMLGQPITTVAADLNWEGTSTTATADPRDAIYFVIPYEYTDKGLYFKYFDAYVTPQFTGWLQSGVMTNYQIFVNHHATGDIWDVLFLLEYKDVEAFAHRDEVKQSVRADLRKNNPAWPVIHELKHSIRIEGRTAITKAILP